LSITVHDNLKTRGGKKNLVEPGGVKNQTVEPWGGFRNGGAWNREEGRGVSKDARPAGENID